MRATDFRWILRGDPFIPSGSLPSDDFPEILKHLVNQRGVSSEKEIETFLRPKLKDLSDPFLIPGMEAAVERILLAIDSQEKICIYGDYDVDGVTSITLMSKILGSYGVEPRSFIPRRGPEGYGLSIAALGRCLEEGEKPDLMIAVDCGTVSVDEVTHLNSLGIDTVIVDHHEPNPEAFPACAALVNPKCGEDFTYLCAAGVVFKLGHALLKTRASGLDLRTLLDLVAVATIADIVPLVDENRLLVRHGLKRLPKTENHGLRALQEVSGMKGKPSSQDVGFRISPRINAAGRMDCPEDALATLLTDCPLSAAELAEKLDAYNRQRQNHEALIRKEAVEQLSEGFDATKDPVIVIGSRDWHHGVVGIVASRLMRQYYKPTFVIAIDEDGIGKASGRSIEGISLVEAIRACEDKLLSGGGHAMAAGLSIEEDSIVDFRKKFAEYVLTNSTEEDRRPRLVYDAEIPFSQLSLDFLDSYELLQPFGNSNPQPVFVSREIDLSRPPYHMKNNHLRLMLRQGYHEQDAVFFSGGERDLPDPPWDIAFTIDRNTFRGKTTLQIIIQDVIASTAS
ncbi:MAG: single-stranded-DNA-specific exonuclease RecJ [Akkermansiaceae bacterium]|jgi:single-stranded-DNA-specific exonuclease|nr:single-stranded-DNA-specific exonuclease RecJ [Akkermansiaceae bacterium]MDP4647065.1 single-stranded-DNA-specific exonuclease RecJ [Akkermansiaceae bacterium]MDP4721821.1 single-stranded-DNA-specific exonuclease RecJ [Akkermansiaceae bacterium]MDP4780562.1 single-stranded-DNA-specific exonuclease RecJ [Akkermansiaceae bacterium]MDP4847408.1 single-stranded-DNA-specific exonuclease RecJ [Akkermansiaceae bacterium]